jgi:Arabinose-binding domain of AraC transcription regulator, N-term
MLCRASLTAGSLGLALQRWCRHHRLLTDDITPQLSRSAHLACISIVEHQPIAPAVRELCLLTLLRYVLGYACWAVDSRISLRGVAFPFAQPPHADAYAALFTVPVQFEAEQASMTFDAPYLQLPMRRDEAALQTMLQRALPLTVLAYRRDRLLGQRVRQALNSPGSHTADSLAAALHTSARTLHRQLRCCCAPKNPSSRWHRRPVLTTKRVSSGPSNNGQACRPRAFARARPTLKLAA